MSCTKGLVHELRCKAHVVNHLAAVECGSDLESRFLLRWFETYTPARLIANPAYPSIKISDIRAEKIPLPPLPEQKRIAKILDAADALRAKRRESLAQLDTLLQSTFLDMFGDPVTNSKGWDRTTLEDFSVKITDGDHHTPKRTESGIKLLSARNVLDGDIDLLNVDFVDTDEYQRMIKRCHPEKVMFSSPARGRLVGYRALNSTNPSYWSEVQHWSRSTTPGQSQNS